MRALWPEGPGKLSYPDRLHVPPRTLGTWLVHGYQLQPWLAVRAWLQQQDSVLELPLIALETVRPPTGRSTL